jgi:hypothetical protein
MLAQLFRKRRAMNIRRTMIAIGVAASAAGAAAQPDKDQPQPKAPPATVAPVVLASARDVRRPSATDRAPDPARRPAARMTTCRCGDPQVTEDQSAGEQPDQ